MSLYPAHACRPVEELVAAIDKVLRDEAAVWRRFHNPRLIGNAARWWAEHPDNPVNRRTP